MLKIITVYGNMLLVAMGRTLLLAFLGLAFACILGMFFGLLSVVKNKVCNIIAQVFVFVIRGVPMIVLAFFIYFGIPYLMPFVGKGLAGYHAPKDSVWRPPLHQMRERPVFTKRDQRVRLRKNRKAAEPEEKQERGE